MKESNHLPGDKIPSHVAIIMDGNGRWARLRGKERIFGHHQGVSAGDGLRKARHGLVDGGQFSSGLRARAGTENLRQIITASVEFGVKYLTIYAFSTENWDRPKDEVQGLMHIVEDVIDKELRELNEEGVQLRHIGRLERLNPKLRKKVLAAIELTKNNNRLIQWQPA